MLRTLVCVSLVAVCLFHAPLVLAQQNWGPWVFEDARPFADVVTSEGAPLGSFQGDPQDLVGLSPQECLINLGHPCEVGAQILELTFSDVPVVNQEGHDLVVFDAPYSVNEYEIAVKPAGAEFTDYLVFLPSVETGQEGCIGTLLGVPVDVSEFGLADGTPIDAVRIKGDCATNPQTASDGAELDISMAAALRGKNRCAAFDCEMPCLSSDDCAPEPPECEADVDCGEFWRCNAEGRCVGCIEDDDCASRRCDLGQCAPGFVGCPEDAGQCGEVGGPDAAVPADAGPAPADAGLVTGTPGSADGGCRCVVGGRRTGSRAWWWTGALAVAVLLGARRRRKSTTTFGSGARGRAP